MKVLHVGPVAAGLSTSGVNQSIRGSIAAQAELGIEVGLLSSSQSSSEISNEELPGITLIRGYDKQHYNPWFISHKWIEQIRKEFGVPDLVIFHSTYIPFHSALGKKCRKEGWPYIVVPHGGLNFLAQTKKRTKKIIGNFLFLRSFVEHSAAIHAKSDSSAREIKSRYAVKHIFTVPNAVDDNLFNICKQLAPADIGSFANGADLMLGYVGRINVHHKGIDLLMEAMAILDSRTEGPKFKLFMVGPFHSNHDQDYALSAIKSLNLEKVVKFLGPKFGTEKWSHFLACDVFVHPSRFEAGIPLALLEAMALRRPCLATPGANMADAIGEGGGWMADENPDSIAKTILEIYKLRDSLPTVGQQLQDMVRSKYTWGKIAEQERDEYTKVMQLCC